MRIPLLVATAIAVLPATTGRWNVLMPGSDTVALSAQRGQARGQTQDQAAARQRFRGMDTNGDGVISRSEWRGSDQSFRVHDWNRDNVLSGDEIREAVRQAQSTNDQDFDAADSFNDWSPARFTALDRNRDGRIVAAEWPYDLDSFRRADRNRDNVLTRTEFVGGDFDDDRGDRFDFLDTDGNNRITRDEWHASDQAFTWLDRNSDNVLSRQEVQGNETTGQADLFDRLDVNRDNRVAPAEWGWSRRSFDELDANRDGTLTRRELAGNTVNAAAGTVTSSATVGGTTRWADSGVVVYSGDRVSFQATGTIRMSPDGADVAEPRGSRTGRFASDAPLPQQFAGALIGRVDQGAPFFIGASTAPIRMSQTGRLYLSHNDDYLGDNSGEFRVAIRVQRATQ